MNNSIKSLKKVIFVFFGIFLLNGVLFAGGRKDEGATEVKGLYRYKLENGLELYVAENDAAPLVHIRLAVRGGGIAQTPETAGVFHLYEHMMFEGDSQFANNADMEKAAQDMGVLAHNAETGVSLVRYYFTVPSDLLRKGLEFWNYAIREPLLSEKALENQKKVVISEIEGNFADPQRVYSYNLFSNLFPDFPWRTDPAGFPANVNKTTTDDLRAMLKKYYIPNNALLLVGGDVNHKEVYSLVKEIFGTWKAGENPWQGERQYQNDNPFNETKYFVMPTDMVSPERAIIRMAYRGPDACRDSRSVEIGNIFDQLMADPSGYFIQALLNDKELEIPNQNYTGGGLSSMRENGIISFFGVINSPQRNLVDRVKYFKSFIADELIPKIHADNKVFSKAQFKQVKQIMKDYNYLGMETAEQVLGQVEYCWDNYSPEYFFGKTKKISKADINRYLEKYIIGKNPLVCVQINPAVYEANKESFAAAGFSEFSVDTAYWWKDLNKASE